MCIFTKWGGKIISLWLPLCGCTSYSYECSIVYEQYIQSYCYQVVTCIDGNYASELYNAAFWSSLYVDWFIHSGTYRTKKSPLYYMLNVLPEKRSDRNLWFHISALYIYIYVHVYIHEIRVYIYIQYIYMYHAHRNCEKSTTQNLKEKEKIRILNIKKKGYVY